MRIGDEGGWVRGRGSVRGCWRRWRVVVVWILCCEGGIRGGRYGWRSFGEWKVGRGSDEEVEGVEGCLYRDMVLGREACMVAGTKRSSRRCDAVDL